MDDTQTRIRNVVESNSGKTPKILLVTWTPPGDRNVGEIILRDLCALLNPQQLRVCEVSQFPATKSAYDGMRLWSPSEAAWRPIGGRVGGLINHLRIVTSFSFQAKEIAKQIAEYASREKIDKIWITLNSQFLVRVASVLGKMTSKPMYPLVWDPTSFLARHQGWDAYSVKWAQNNFDNAMRASSSAMVVSDSMAEEYSTRFNVECNVVRHSFDVARLVNSAAAVDDGFLKIGFAGTLYDSGQLDCLISALNEIEWVISGRKVRLRIIGNYYRFNKLSVPVNIELLGWRSTEETRRLLSDCEFTYLPIPFGDYFFDFAKFAFPTKLSTYLAAGRPVLVHAPEYAAPVSFCRINKFGVACPSMSATDLRNSILELMEPSSYASFQENVGVTCSEYFSTEVMRRQFAKFIGVDPNCLGVSSRSKN